MVNEFLDHNGKALAELSLKHLTTSMDAATMDDLRTRRQQIKTLVLELTTLRPIGVSKPGLVPEDTEQVPMPWARKRHPRAQKAQEQGVGKGSRPSGDSSVQANESITTAQTAHERLQLSARLTAQETRAQAAEEGHRRLLRQYHTAASCAEVEAGTAMRLRLELGGLGQVVSVVGTHERMYVYIYILTNTLNTNTRRL